VVEIRPINPENLAKIRLLWPTNLKREPDKEMNVVRSHHVTEHAEAIALFGFKNPLEITAAISCEFQKEFLFMTPMRNVPDMPWDVMSVCSWHHIYPFL